MLERHKQLDDFAELEEQLRSLPQPLAPGELLDRLLADIPKNVPGMARKNKARIRWLVAAAAVGMLASLIFVRRQPNPEQERAVSLSYVLYHANAKETDPCAILPP